MKNFLNYVEIRTKITSLMTFILVLLLLIYHHVEIKLLETVVFFAGMFIFDLTTTTINNYIDSKSNHQDYGFSRKTLKVILFALLGISTGFGLWLVFLTDYIVLLIGAFCFFVGIIYTFGPIAISRQPYGEIVSGILYGYFIPFLLLYINLQEKFLTVDLNKTILISLNADILIKFIIFGFVPTLLTSAIMLGNNTCDVEKDILVKRYTLPYYIGQANAVKLLWSLYALVYVGVGVGVVAGVYHPLMLLMLLTAPRVLKNAKEFGKECNKERSFPYVIKNFIMIMVSLIVLQLLILIIR